MNISGRFNHFVWISHRDGDKSYCTLSSQLAFARQSIELLKNEGKKVVPVPLTFAAARSSNNNNNNSGEAASDPSLPSPSSGHQLHLSQFAEAIAHEVQCDVYYFALAGHTIPGRTRQEEDTANEYTAAEIAMLFYEATIGNKEVAEAFALQAERCAARRRRENNGELRFCFLFFTCNSALAALSRMQSQEEQQQEMIQRTFIGKFFTTFMQLLGTRGHLVSRAGDTTVIAARKQCRSGGNDGAFGFSLEAVGYRGFFNQLQKGKSIWVQNAFMEKNVTKEDFGYKLKFSIVSPSLQVVASSPPPFPAAAAAATMPLHSSFTSAATVIFPDSSAHRYWKVHTNVGVWEETTGFIERTEDDAEEEEEEEDGE